MRRIPARLASGLLAGLVTASLAVPLAAPAQAATVYGNDISWPQCSAGGAKGLPLPKKGAGFVIVGLTRGVPYTTNPCLSSHVAHTRAIGAKLAVYTFAAYPTAGELRSKGASGPYTTRTATGRLQNAGYAQGKWSVATLKAKRIKVPMVWLDIEHRTSHKWSKSTAANRAVVAGTVKALTDAGYKVGYYSYASAWKDIMGGVRSSLPVWATVGKTSRTKAAAMCSKPSFSGGPVIVSQWYDNTRDYDLICPTAVKTTTRTVSASSLAPYRALTLKRGSRGTAVKALQRVVGTSADGIFGPKTKAAVVRYQKKHKLRADGVVNVNDWKAMGAYKTRKVTTPGLSAYFA
jgi:peptidoglycan hydrolase-like protein with peptidoglycan-binding domain